MSKRHQRIRGLRNYGLLKGRVIQGKEERGRGTPHYQILVIADGRPHRVSINVRSAHAPHDLLYLLTDDWRHPLTASLPDLPDGFHAKADRGPTLDYIRGNLFDRRRFRPVPHHLPGDDNDLNDRLGLQMRRAATDPDAVLYAFGNHWGPERQPDRVFGFRPGYGLHDIHMNQGNPDLPRGERDHFGENGVHQDGGLLIHYPKEDRWVGIFLAFQPQIWHTDDQTGAPRFAREEAGPADRIAWVEPDGSVRIVAALVNPFGPAPEAEVVTLLNASPERLNLAGWAIVNDRGEATSLVGSIAPGAALAVSLSSAAPLGNEGGTITLIDAVGMKVDGVSYTRAQAAREGWTLVF